MAADPSDRNYLMELTGRLANSLAGFPAEFRARHGSFLKSIQMPAGGFPDREGNCDLYYTSFALRGLACLNALEAPTVQRAAAYLSACARDKASIVDFLSLLYGREVIRMGGGPDIFADSRPEWPDRVASALEAYRKSDGGYAKAAEGETGSTYHTFLVALCYQMIGRAMPDRERVVSFLLSRRRDDGGFVEVGPARRGGTNPTAAAVALWILLDGSEGDITRLAADFLVAMQSPEGGLRANIRTPMADLLSTFTGLLTLADLGYADRLDLKGMVRFVNEMELPGGGFRGGFWDESTDAEYTFYGLGCLAAISHKSAADY